jgi:hypothetical protein
MHQLGRILFPVDFSNRCTAAAPRHDHGEGLQRRGHPAARLVDSPVWCGEFTPAELQPVDEEQLI